MHVPETLRDGSISLRDSILLDKKGLAYESPVLDINQDEKVIKFGVLNIGERFSVQVMMALINFFQDMKFKLLYWDSLANYYFFYFIVPQGMRRFRNPKNLIESIGLKAQ